MGAVMSQCRTLLCCARARTGWIALLCAVAPGVLGPLPLPPAVLAQGTAGSTGHAIAMHGAPLLAPSFPHFPYVDPNAPKGGRLRLGLLGTFDSLRPFIVRGVVPSGLREYVFESLMVRAGDEPFTLYGLLADAIDVPADRSEITFHLRAEARFSDGRPVTPDDVLFSHQLLKEKGLPFFRSYYRKVVRTEKVGPRGVRFTFEAGSDREIALIMGLMPVLPRHLFSIETYERTSLEPPIGSGPYVVDKVDPGRALIFRRNPAYWGRDLAVNRGRFNFDEIRYDFFRDSGALFESFKAGQIDVRFEDDPTRWAEAYDFAAIKDGRVVKRDFPVATPAGMSALVFNARRPVFQDQRVRRALIRLFDGEWFNRSLYHGLYRRTESFFARSELASAGRAADARERALLEPYRADFGEGALEAASLFPASSGSGSDRSGLNEAFRLLSEAGYTMQGKALVHRETGRPLTFEFLASSRAQERLMLTFARTLERMGIMVRIRQVDSAQYWSRTKSYDFDMMQWSWGASLSPGNEQANRWSIKAAETDGTLNYAGVKSPAADAMIAAMLKAEGREDFVAAVRALDRVLLAGDYVIPLFHPPAQWVAHWSHLKQPARPPLAGTDLDTWWADP